MTSPHSPVEDWGRIHLAAMILSMRPIPIGYVTNVHAAEVCDGPCVFHGPSAHAMVSWAAYYRRDRDMIERRCPCHGVHHPDPDWVARCRRLHPDEDGFGIHGCHGCCRGLYQIPPMAAADDVQVP